MFFGRSHFGRSLVPRWVPPWLIDSAIAVIAAIAIVRITHSAGADQPEHRALDALAWALLVGEALALAWRRPRPVEVWGVALAANIIYFARDYPNGPAPAPLLFALYTVALTDSRRRTLVATAVTMVSIVGVKLMFSDDGLSNPVSLAATGWAAAVVFKGLATRSHRENVASRQERAEQAERARLEAKDEEARRRTDEERLRIAREVHDVVSHNLAVIRVQAGVALHLLDQDKRPDHAREALEAIKQSSSDALADLRSTLGALRDGATDSRGPVAGMARLQSLVDNATATGVTTELSVRGDLTALSPAVDLAAYRVLQESLTNVVRHAEARTAQVRVESCDGRLELEVTDDGTAGAAGDTASGHGLTGMAERVGSLGGRVETGPRPGGGFRVWAVLPLSADVQARP